MPSIWNIVAYMILGEIGGIVLWGAVKAGIYARRERHDRFWFWFHAKDTLLYLAIGGPILALAWHMLG